jgi:hypothetical protein
MARRCSRVRAVVRRQAHGGRGGWVSAVACPDGVRSGGLSCNLGNDPASAGLALNATPR